MLDPVLLESFLAVAQTRNFSEAGRRLGLRQSTVSQHVRKLEDAAGRRLFVRDTHRVVPTADGEAMVGFARSILEANERAQRYFAGSQVRGRVRFGDLGGFRLLPPAGVAARFRPAHPLVDLELTVDLSATLYTRCWMRATLDVALCKRRAGDDRGRLVWRDRLAWIGTEATRIDPGAPLPLILYTPPSITRTVALETLERAGRPWRIVCSSGSLSGLRAAALAGLGMTRARAGADAGGADGDAGCACGCRSLAEVEFVVLGARAGERGPAAELAEAILANGDRLQRRG